MRRRAAGARPGSPIARLTAGGTEGNERLTAATGVVLLVLLAALGVTILRIHPLLSEHMFLGVLLIGPVALKMGSTGYRFIRYYTAEPRYRRKGPPPLLLRLLAPLVVLSTVVVFASGVALLLIGPSSRQPLLLDSQGELLRLARGDGGARARTSRRAAARARLRPVRALPAQRMPTQAAAVARSRSAGCCSWASSPRSS